MPVAMNSRGFSFTLARGRYGDWYADNLCRVCGGCVFGERDCIAGFAAANVRGVCSDLSLSIECKKHCQLQTYLRDTLRDVFPEKTESVQGSPSSRHSSSAARRTRPSAAGCWLQPEAHGAWQNVLKKVLISSGRAGDAADALPIAGNRRTGAGSQPCTSN